MAAAAAGWDLGPGAGPRLDDKLVVKTLNALEDLAATIPNYTGRLEDKELLEERQRTLLKNDGSIHTTGGVGEEVRFRVRERIGEGTFCVVFGGELYSGNPAKGEERPIALKFELRKTDSTQLRNEYRIYKKFETAHGIPRIYAFGDVNFHKVLAMDLLGPSLETLFQGFNRRFSVKTVAMLAKQMLARIQTVHDCGLIYRDIKPDNFLIGIPHTDDTATIYLVDFGMAKVYRDPETKEHIPFGEAQSLSGTARYMSINAHCRRSQSRRDDLEAIGHVFMYFLRGNLPWQGVKAPQNDQRYELMCEKKQATSIEDLCGEFPKEFAEYLTYTRGLTFEGDPDYDYLQGLFSQVLAGLGEADDGVYDWLLPKGTAQPTLSASVAEARVSPERGPQPDADMVQARSASPMLVATEPPPPSSPPGKRRRSEFASDLVPPMRIRPKIATFSFYDGDAQRVLATLHREIMAKRYAFRRAVSGGGRTTPSAAMAAAAVAAISGPSNTLSNSIARFRNPMRGAATSLVSPAFTDLMDLTLGAVNTELEDMSDKMLQGGDWTGMARVRASFDRLTDAVQREIQRLQQMQRRSNERAASEASTSSVGKDPASDSLQPPPAQAMVAKGRGGGEGGMAEDIVVDVEELMLEGQTGSGPLLVAEAGPAGLLAGAKDDKIEPRRTTAKSRPQPRESTAVSPVAADEWPLQPKMGALSLNMGPPLDADDTDSKLEADSENADDYDDSAFALVYRTASGTQKVLRMPGGRQPE